MDSFYRPGGDTILPAEQCKYIKLGYLKTILHL